MRCSKKIQALLSAKDYEAACIGLPTGVEYLERIVLDLDRMSEALAVCWLSVLLCNPFRLSKILQASEVERLSRYLMAKVHKEDKLGEVVRRSIALLIKNRLLDEEPGTESIMSYDGHKYSMLGADVDAYSFYRMGRQLSVLINRELLYRALGPHCMEIEEDDPELVKQYKLGMRGHSVVEETAVADVTYILQFLNSGGANFGWELSMSLSAVESFMAPGELEAWLIAQLPGDVFGDETHWINTMNALGLLKTLGTLPKELRFILTALQFDREYNRKAKSVRESALSLLWSLWSRGKQYATATDGMDIGNAILNGVLVVAIFDVDYNCRRSALSVIKKAIGVDGWASQAFCQDDKELLETLEPGSLRRLEACSALFCKIRGKEALQRSIYQLLWHYNREHREVAAKIYTTYYDSTGVNTICKYGTPVEMDASHLLLYHSCDKNNAACDKNRIEIKLNKVVLADTNTPHTSDNGASMNYYKEFLKEKSMDAATIFKSKNGAAAVESYLRAIQRCQFVETNQSKKNILFLIKQNITVTKPFLDCLKLVGGDHSFNKALFALVYRNQCGLIANCYNSGFRKNFVAICLENLERNNNVEQTLTALIWGCRDIADERLVALALSYLNDYSVDSYSGDAGCLIRSKAFTYAFILSNPILPSIIPRFLADKSVKIRNQVITLLTVSHFKESACQFQHIKPFCSPELDLVSLSSLAGFPDLMRQLIVFFKQHEESNKAAVSREEAYFAALFVAFRGNRGFYEGIINTVASADRRLLSILRPHITAQQEYFLEEVQLLLNIRSIPLLAILKFLVYLQLINTKPALRTVLHAIEKTALSPIEKSLLSCILK